MELEDKNVEVVEENDKSLKVEYETPRLHRRVLANLIDAMIFILLFITLFIPTNAIAKVTPSYKAADNLIAMTREECGLYVYVESTKTWFLYPTYYDNYEDGASDYVKVTACEKSIDDFHTYLQSKYESGDITLLDYNTAIEDYDSYRLGLVYHNKPYFIEVDGEIIKNNGEDGCGASLSDYYKNVYHIYILQNCSGFLVTYFPNYYNALRLQSNVLFFAEIPIAYSLAGILVYFVPPLIFKRGYKTIGKLAYRVGLIDTKTVLVPSFGKWIARFFIFFIAELILSLFTFGIPFIISFTMMVVTKKKQGFPDYMLGLMEVDTDKANLYFSRYEASVLSLEGRKKGVRFQMRRKIY